MPQASVKRLIDCKKDKLIKVVLDVESYPEFVPYCHDAKIYENKTEHNFIKIIADLTIGKGPFKDTYKSDVRYDIKKDFIFVTNIDGPLKYLKNKWRFKERGTKTEVSFEIDFEINNKFLNIIMTKSFQYGLDKIADSFQNRAEVLNSR
jgi:coenzyme Q-binding protein COQ10